MICTSKFNLHSDTDPVVNSPMVDAKTDRSMFEPATKGIDRAVIEAFVTVVKMDSDSCAAVFDLVGVFERTLVATWMDAERQLDYFGHSEDQQ